MEEVKSLCKKPKYVEIDGVEFKVVDHNDPCAPMDRVRAEMEGSKVLTEEEYRKLTHSKFESDSKEPKSTQIVKETIIEQSVSEGDPIKRKIAEIDLEIAEAENKLEIMRAAEPCRPCAERRLRKITRQEARRVYDSAAAAAEEAKSWDEAAAEEEFQELEKNEP